MLSIAAPATEEINLWSGEITLGANFQSGNTDSMSGSAAVDVRRRSVDSRLLASYLGLYSETNEEVIEENQRAVSSLDLFLSQYAYYRPYYVEVISNPIINISYKVTAATGGGFYLSDTDQQSLTVGGNVGFQYLRYDETLPNEEEIGRSAVLMLNLNFERDLLSDVEFHFNYEIQFVSSSSGQRVHFLDTGFDIDITGDLEFTAQLIATRTAKPQADANGIFPEKNDTNLIFGLSYEF